MRRFNGVVVVVVAIAMLVGRVWFDDAKNDVPRLRENVHHTSSSAFMFLLYSSSCVDDDDVFRVRENS